MLYVRQFHPTTLTPYSLHMGGVQVFRLLHSETFALILSATCPHTVPEVMETKSDGSMQLSRTPVKIPALATRQRMKIPLRI
ncbi:hypothetical protein GCK32_020526, partial [Trichostrongylus colubriformis]